MLTPTRNRQSFWPRCLGCFLTQDYPNLEWIILDDGEPIRDLLPLEDRRIHYLHELPIRNHGQKMNRCMELASGEYAIVVDDDDWYAPDRTTKQITPMLESPDVQVTGTSQLYYVIDGKRRAFQYVNSTQGSWMMGIAFRRSAWEAQRFEGRLSGADYEFMNRFPQEQWRDLKDMSLMVSSIHRMNTVPKYAPSLAFVEVPWSVMENGAGTFVSSPQAPAPNTSPTGVGH